MEKIVLIPQKSADETIAAYRKYASACCDRFKTAIPKQLDISTLNTLIIADLENIDNRQYLLHIADIATFYRLHSTSAHFLNYALRGHSKAQREAIQLAAISSAGRVSLPLSPPTNGITLLNKLTQQIPDTHPGSPHLPEYLYTYTVYMMGTPLTLLENKIKAIQERWMQLGKRSQNIASAARGLNAYILNDIPRIRAATQYIRSVETWGLEKK